MEGRPEQIVDGLVEEACRDRLKSEKLFQLAEYVMNNTDWIRNIPEVEGYGLGPVEKTVDSMVMSQFKKKGMSWVRHGVNPLLKLRLLKLNGEWDAYWRQKKEKLPCYANEMPSWQ